jgi:GTP-binding protein Era
MTREPYRCGAVALMGPPNAGKSTLLNALVGQKVAIVTAKPQTTRNRILGIVTDARAQVIFMDTPGVHASRLQRGHMNKLMLQAAWQSLNEADVAMLVLDGDLYLRKPDALERELAPMLPALNGPRSAPLVIALNKVDLFHDKSRMLPLLASLQGHFPQAEVFPVSALTRDGTEQLLDLARALLPEAGARFPEDQLTTAPARFMVTEIIREKLFDRLRQEVPYAVAVDVEHWQEDTERGQVTIHAVIYVGRPSHKAMVIGRGGEGVKAVGTAARKEIKELLGCKVHLELWVRVREDWAGDPRFLSAIGLGMEAGCDMYD